jgi:hypothetical protein
LTCFKTVTKAVVDIEKKVLAIDAELHSDLEAYLIEHGSDQENLWGINLYPNKSKDDFIEYTALINIRPHQNNKSMEVEDTNIKEKIQNVIDNLVDYET